MLNKVFPFLLLRHRFALAQNGSICKHSYSTRNVTFSRAVCLQTLSIIAAEASNGSFKVCNAFFKDWRVPGHCKLFRSNFFVRQSAVQGFHWYNSQAILDLGEILHVSYVVMVISGCLHHSTVAVHLFQRSFIAFLKKLPPARLHPKKIVDFCDGAALQYKIRKKFLSFCHHKNDFGVKAEWHFSATS